MKRFWKVVTVLSFSLVSFVACHKEERASHAPEQPKVAKLPTKPKKLPDVKPEQAGESVRALFTLIANGPVHLLNVAEENHLYRVTLEVEGQQEPQQKSVYVTKDGVYLVEAITDLAQSYQELTDQKRFSECLRDKGVRVLVDPATREGQAQLMIFGRFAHLVAINCAASPENCKQLGAEALPAIMFQNKVESGVKSPDWLQTLTGCK